MDKLLVLDLDETLVKSLASKPTQPHTTIKQTDGTLVYVIKRPKLDEFIDYVFANFQVAFWSSGEDQYVESVVKFIVSNHKPLFVWGRSKCTIKYMYEEGNYVYLKILKKIKSHYIGSILIVDDTLEKAMRNYGNLILIEPFDGWVGDRELVKLMNYLPTIKDCANVRLLNKISWAGPGNDVYSNRSPSP